MKTLKVKTTINAFERANYYLKYVEEKLIESDRSEEAKHVEIFRTDLYKSFEEAHKEKTGGEG